MTHRPIAWLILSLTACSVVAVRGRNVNRLQLLTIENYMDTSAEPCDDFYQHACGHWSRVHTNGNYYDTIGLIDFKVNHEYARILKHLKKRRKKQEPHVRNVLDYYKSCVSMDTYQPERYLAWLQEREDISWPAALPVSGRTSRSRRGNHDWLRMLGVLRKYGLNGVLIEETVIQKRNDARIFLIDIDKPVMNGGFRPLDYEKFVLVMDYLNVTSRARIVELWEDIQAFELQLKALDDIEDEDGSGEHTLSELDMPWLTKYLRIVTDEPVNKHMEITIQNLPYFQVLFTVLGYYEPEFICRYLMIRFLWHLHIEGPSNFLKQDCILHTRGMLPLAMSWLYEKHNPDLLDQKDHIERLFQKLIQHFTHTLTENSNHFDASILKFLRNKVNTMKIKIGNLPRPRTTEKVKEFYQDLKLSPSDFYSNHLQLLRFFVQAQHKRLQTAIEPDQSFYHLEDPETGISSSPYYLLRSNVIIVPLTLLHLPIYHANLNVLFEYSSLGFLLAHEITHGFDESGVEFDQLGNMRGPSETIKANLIFDANLNCLRSSDPQIVDEKIADVSGLRWAYEAYFQNATTAGNGAARSQRQLHGTDMPDERLFFLNFAHFFCGVSSMEEFDSTEHGPRRQRVIDTLANFAEFARVYKCPLGSRMHPERKCQLWR